MKKWKEVRLQDLVYFQRGFDITKDKQELGDVPVISSSGVTSYHNKYMADGPGVIMGRKGSLGTIYFSKENYWPHDTTLWSKDFKGNDPKYAYYFLHTFDFKNFNVGGANPTLNRNHIHDLRIPLPPLPTQQRIAAILSAYDDLIENNRRRITLLEDSARLLYKEWFVKFQFPSHEKVKVKNGLPEGWERGAITDFYKTSSGGTPSRTKPEYFTGEINWVKTQELKNGFIFDTDEKITKDAVQNSSAKLFPENTVLFAMYGATIGQLGIIAKESTTNQACCAFIPMHHSANYIYMFLFLLENKLRFINLSQGAAQPNVNQEVMKQFPMLMPNKFLMDNFVSSLSPIFNQIKTLTHQTQKLREARNILLPKLMNGTIEV